MERPRGELARCTSAPPTLLTSLQGSCPDLCLSGRRDSGERGRQLKRESMKIQEAKGDRKDRGGAPWAMLHRCLWLQTSFLNVPLEPGQPHKHFCAGWQGVGT